MDPSAAACHKYISCTGLVVILRTCHADGMQSEDLCTAHVHVGESATRYDAACSVLYYFPCRSTHLSGATALVRFQRLKHP